MDTPKVVLYYEQIEKNISEMAELAVQAGVSLRPHIKSHKLVHLAKDQIKAGACGITVAKLGEAEVMARHGIKDIFIANQIIGAEKWERLFALQDKVNLSVGVDSITGAQALSNAMSQYGALKKLDVLIEVDTGLKRCGVQPGPEIIGLAKEISSLEGLKLKGIFTHAGHSYGAKNSEELDYIARSEGELLVEAALEVRKAGIPLEVVSVGSTPTVRKSAFIKGVTEIRPGNYVFNDAIQLSLAVIPALEYCALRVFSTVISHPAPQRWVIDAGSKALALDKGAHGNTSIRGHGIIIDHPNLSIVRLSEEHGIVEGDDEYLQIGDVIEIIPNHACTVINLFDEVEVWQGKKKEQWKVDARGRNN